MSKLATVLIIDDNPRCLEFMTLAFSAHGGVDVAGAIVEYWRRGELPQH
jgi:hypothetical protein